MAKLASFCSFLALGCLYSTVDTYPIGDLTLDGLLGGIEAMTVYQRRRMAESNSCSYRGLVAVTAANKVLFSGIYQSGTVRVPTDAMTIIMSSNAFLPLVIFGGDGTAQARIETGGVAAMTERNNDGTSSITLSRGFSSGSCPSSDEAILYSAATMQIDIGTCKIVSFLGDEPFSRLHVYDRMLRVDPLARNNLRGCCADVLPNILRRRVQLGNPAESDVARSFVCLKSTLGICPGGIGSPIYCTDTRSGDNVVVGMADSGHCQEGEYFGAIDFTMGTLVGFSK